VTCVEHWRIASGDAVDVVLVRARFCGTTNGVTMPKIHGRRLPTQVYFAVPPGASGGFADFLNPGYARMNPLDRSGRAVAVHCTESTPPQSQSS